MTGTPKPHRLQDRTFGFVIAGALLVVSGVAWWLFDRVLEWVLWTSLGLFATALVAPWVLLPLNRLWTRIAARIGVVTNYLVLGLILYVIFTPVGLILRISRDAMRRKFDATSPSYLTKVQRQSDAKTFPDWF